MLPLFAFALTQRRPNFPPTAARAEWLIVENQKSYSTLSTGLKLCSTSYGRTASGLFYTTWSSYTTDLPKKMVL